MVNVNKIFREFQTQQFNVPKISTEVVVLYDNLCTELIQSWSLRIAFEAIVQMSSRVGGHRQLTVNAIDRFDTIQHACKIRSTEQRCSFSCRVIANCIHKPQA